MKAHRSITRFACRARGVAFRSSAARGASAQEAEAPPRQHWSFPGPFGIYDPAQLQRGFKIYREVCSTCHSLKLLAFRNLADPGGPGFQRSAGGGDRGRLPGHRRAERPGRDVPAARARFADYFPPPFPNDQAARAALGGGLPPDMSVLAKARSYEAGFPWFIFDAFTAYQEDGPDYIHAILNGYDRSAGRLHAAAGRPVQQIFPRPRHRHAEAAERRPGRIYRRHARRRSTNTAATSPPS